MERYSRDDQLRYYDEETSKLLDIAIIYGILIGIFFTLVILAIYLWS